MPYLKDTNTTPITAMLTLTAPTPRDRSTVLAIRDTQEMESRVLVRYFDKYFSVMVWSGRGDGQY